MEGSTAIGPLGGADGVGGSAGSSGISGGLGGASGGGAGGDGNGEGGGRRGESNQGPESDDDTSETEDEDEDQATKFKNGGKRAQSEGADPKASKERQKRSQKVSSAEPERTGGRQGSQQVAPGIHLQWLEQDRQNASKPKTNATGPSLPQPNCQPRVRGNRPLPDERTPRRCSSCLAAQRQAASSTASNQRPTSRNRGRDWWDAVAPAAAATGSTRDTAATLDEGDRVNEELEEQERTMRRQNGAKRRRREAARGRSTASAPRGVQKKGKKRRGRK